MQETPRGRWLRPFAGGLASLGSTLAAPFRRPRRAAGTRVETYELVCPFHRGDLLLAIQVAHTVTQLGLRVRLHTSSELREWADAFDVPFPVHFLATPVPPAEGAEAGVARALDEVVALPDASPRLVRFHPVRSMRLSRRPLLDGVLEQFGFRRPFPRLCALPPRIRPDDVAWAGERLARRKPPVVLIQTRGGWSLKDLPPHLGARVRDLVSSLGGSLVQIGGPADPSETFCDDSIRDGLTPSRWRALFGRAAAVLGVDSWSVHLAAILDVPHAVFYGPTDADLVHSRNRFAGRVAPAVVVRSSVPCSPCETLHCVAFPGARHCAGYGLGLLPALARLIAGGRHGSGD